MKTEIDGKIIELPDNYDPRNEKDEYMCVNHRAYFKIKLQNWLNEIKTKLTARYLDDENGDFRSTDESDKITMEENILTELRSKDRLRKLAQKIEEFINKIDKDVYGYCEESGNEIGINRLMVRPIARYCVEIQDKKDKEEEEQEMYERQSKIEKVNNSEYMKHNQNDSDNYE